MNDPKKQRRLEHLRHEVYEGMSVQAQKCLTEDFNLGLTQREALWISNQLVNYLAEYWSGQTLTFPKDHIFNIDERDFEIFNKVNGKNMMEVAREYKLTKNGLYRVIRRIRGRAIRRAGQLDIFGNPQ